MRMLDQVHKADIRADIRLADAITLGGAPLTSKAGSEAKQKWIKQMESTLQSS